MKEINGNLFDQNANAICITTNGTLKCDGRCVMGAGVALEAAQQDPGVALRLGQHIKENGNVLGIIGAQGKEPGTVRYMVSFPVKHNYWEKADLKLIEQSAKQLRALTDLMGWKDVVIPKPGCGAGRLTWDQVKPVLEKYFDDRFTIIDL
jgi:hypothetical protein